MGLCATISKVSTQADLMSELVILIPGNPSVPGIYEHFIKQVVTDLKKGKEVTYKILSHLGQCNNRITIRNNITVHDVINDHRDQILKLIKKYSPEKIILIGHSLGSSVTIFLYQELSSIIDEFIVLCPFIGPSENNVKYLKMFKNPVIRFGMKNLSHTILLNKKISHAFFKKWLGDNPFNEHIPKEIKKPYYIKNFFSLASNYINDFEELDIQERMLRMKPQKTLFVFASNDFWVPEEIMNQLSKSSNLYLCKDIQHDFCLSKEQYQTVSTIIKNHYQSRI
jgi:pimeloyl-ACP methyl ester carboxylesterase